VIHPSRGIWPGRHRWLAVVSGLGILILVVAVPRLPLPWRVAWVWTFLSTAPGFGLGADRWFLGHAVPLRLGAVVLVSLSWDVALMAGFALTGVGLVVGFWVLAFSPLLALGLSRFGYRRRDNKALGEAPRSRSTPRWQWSLLVGVMLLSAGFVSRQPAEIRLDSDLPAHMGAIRDAGVENRWIPLDRSIPGKVRVRDPRMGIFHGWNAAVAEVMAADPSEVWVHSAVVWTPLFVLAFATLFTALGLDVPMALLASMALATGAGGGRPLGVWASIYPAQAALVYAVFALSWFLFWMQEPGAPIATRRLLALGAALGLSVLVHPFAWWAACLVLLHMVLLFAVLRKGRSVRLSLGFLLSAGVTGGLLLLPAMVHSRHGMGGVQWEPSGVLYWFGQWFSIDPLLLLRWGGWLGPLALISAVLHWRRAGTNGSTVGLLALTLPVWTIALDPLVQPAVYARVGYLSERLGLVAAGPAALVFGLSALSGARRRKWGRMGAGLILGVLVVQSSPAWMRTPYRSTAATRSVLEDLRQLPNSLPEPVLSDPLTSYALRAVRSIRPVLLPVAHASPLDPGLPERLGRFRRILSPDTAVGELSGLLGQMGAGSLLLTTGVEELYRRPEFGFIPRESRQVGLEGALTELGVERSYRLGRCSVFDLSEMEKRASAGDRKPAPIVSRGSASGIVLEDVQVVEAMLSPGDSLHLEATFSAGGGMGERWETVRLALVRNSPPVPAGFQGIGKLYRKLVRQRRQVGSDRVAFHWVPGDGYHFGEGAFREWRAFRLPADLLPGEYRVMARVEPGTWRPNRHIKDYLSDRPGWSGTVRDRVTVEPRED